MHKYLLHQLGGADFWRIKYLIRAPNIVPHRWWYVSAAIFAGAKILSSETAFLHKCTGQLKYSQRASHENLVTSLHQ